MILLLYFETSQSMHQNVATAWPTWLELFKGQSILNSTVCLQFHMDAHCSIAFLLSCSVLLSSHPLFPSQFIYLYKLDILHGGLVLSPPWSGKEINPVATGSVFLPSLPCPLVSPRFGHPLPPNYPPVSTPHSLDHSWQNCPALQPQQWT